LGSKSNYDDGIALTLNYINNHKVALLFVAIILFSIIRIATAFHSGYSARPYDALSIFVTEPIRYLLIVICVIVVVIAGELNRNRKALVFLALIILLIVGLIPTGHFVTLDALLSVRNANPEEFRDEARTLFIEYASNTMFSDRPQRVLNQYAVFPRSKLPLPILRANIGDVFILKRYILIEKFGLGGSFRGFIVFREGADIWKNDKPVMLLAGCSYCWKVRIIDGLYWYHAAPVEEENARLDFLSE
jgi:hypothetical protein